MNLDSLVYPYPSYKSSEKIREEMKDKYEIINIPVFEKNIKGYN